MIPVVICPTCGASSVSDGPLEKRFVVIFSRGILGTPGYCDVYLVSIDREGPIGSGDGEDAFVFQERSAAEVAAVMVGGEVMEVEGKPE